MSATIRPLRAGLDLYRLFGIADNRSDRAGAEEALSIVLGANPDLAPGGWCDDLANAEAAARFRRQPGVRLRPHLVEAFAWGRIFLSLGCRGVMPRGWNGTSATQLACLAEEACEAVLRRRVVVEPGVMCAAALSCGISVRRHADGPDAQIRVYHVLESRR